MYNEIKGKKELYKKIKENSLPSKVRIFICIAFGKIFISQIPNLLRSMSEIKYLIELNNPEFISFIYFAKNEIHSILFEEEEFIDIKYDPEKLELPFLFYFSLLIKDKPDIINYSFQFNFIEENIKDIQNIVKKNQFKVILKSKINIDLINNFRGMDNYDEDKYDEILNKTENENKNFIINNIALKNLNLFYNDDKIISIPIDRLCIDIIISLIKLKKFEDFDYTINILNQIEIENIFITEAMFQELHNLLNSYEDYITDYSLTENEDLFNEKKINFFYILLKYIFKKSFYIYQIEFLYKQRNFILGELLNIPKKKINNKLEYVLRMMLDSDYYFEDKLDQLKEVLIYFKNFLFETKEKDIAIIEDVIKNNTLGYHKYLKYYDIAKKMNIRKDIINYLFELNNNNKENRIQESVDEWNTIEFMINEKKIEGIDNKIIGALIKYFKDQSKQNELKNIFIQDDIINYFINNAVQVESKSTMMTSTMAQDNKKKNMDAGKPKTDKDILLSLLLTKSEIILHTNKKEKKDEKIYFIYDKISYGEDHKEINYEEFFNIKSEYKKKCENKQFDNKEERILANNIVKLFDFLEEFEKSISTEFLYIYNLIIKLAFTKEEINDNSNPEIDNITVIYTFFNPINYKQSSFKDVNILINGTNSAIQGCEFLLIEINNESFKGIEYKEFNFKEEQSKLNDNKKGINLLKYLESILILLIL